ncbi:alpha/beta hydrolase [Congregibacter sp.]|uniref:alpha/beta hydrolase n=1 Tax=Congregibacter sp. TaxID=2744308 RepID=UPI0038583A93
MFLLKTSALRLGIATLSIGMFAALGSIRVAAEIIQLDEQNPTLSGRLTRSAAWPDGSVALILHGTLSHRDTEIIESLETLLGEEDVSTLAINLSLGLHNRVQAFSCDDLHIHRESDASNELSRWSHWLGEQGVSDITAIGHSRGANQIARYAKDSGDTRIAQLVLVAPPQWSIEKTRQAYARRHADSLDDLLAEAEAMIAVGDGGKAMPMPLGLLYCQDAHATAESFVSYYSDDPLRDTPKLLSQLTLPVLVISGSNDTIAPGLPSALQQRAPNVVGEEIDGADHFFRDLYADELVEIAIDFINSNP